MVARTTAMIVTDADIERVHGYANFGPTMSKRDVVDEGVLKYAFGHSSGHTQMSIILEHGLIRKPKPGYYTATLTIKGFSYLRSMFNENIMPKIMDLRNV